MDVSAAFALAAVATGLALLLGAGWWRARASARQLAAKLNAELALSESAAATGIWTDDLVQGTSTWSPGFYRILGVAPYAYPPRPLDRIDLVPSAEYDALRQAYAAVREAGGARTIETRLRRPDGTQCDIAISLQLHTGAEGQPLRMSGTIADITRLKNAERAIAERDEQVQRAISASRAAIWDWDLESGSFYVSSRFGEIVDLPREPWSPSLEFHDQLCHPDDLPRVREAMNIHAANGTLLDIEYRLRRSDGTEIWVQSKGRAVASRDGKPARSIGSLVDITLRREMEAALAQKQEILELAVEAAEAGYFEQRFDTGEVTWSARLRRILGIPADRSARMEYIYEHVFPEDLPDFLIALDIFTRGRAPLDVKLRVQHSDGHYIWLHLRAAQHVDAGGRRLRIIGFVLEVSDQVAAQRALADSERKFRNLVEGSIQGVVIHRRFRPLFCNAAYAHLLGYETPEDVLVLPSLTVHIAPREDEDNETLWERMISGQMDGKVFRSQFMHRSGRKVWFDVVGRVIQWEGAPAWQVAAIEVTEQKRFEDELRETRDRLQQKADELSALAQNLERERARAEQANLAKSQFLAMMSHELRTPLTGVIGMADLLLLSNLSEEQERVTQLLVRSARMLLDLLNDLLDFSKIEAGQIEVEAVPFSIVGVMTEISELYAAPLSDKNLQLEIRVAPHVKDAVIGDPKRLRQVLSNLVSNAAKFTHKGGITIDVDMESRDGGLLLRLAVTDTGIGISAEDASRLFQPFVQADISTSRKYGGSGLGLAICKRLVNAMGGDITLESVLGKGSKFSFFIRVLPASAAPNSDPAKVAVAVVGQDRTLDILIAEDNDTTRYLLGTMLGRLGHRVMSAADGQQAVELCAKARFDLVLMDMQMPIMDGVDATREIRRLPGEIAQVPIIALTADAIPEHRPGFLDAGANAVVVKPVVWAELGEEIDRLVPGAAVSQHLKHGMAREHAADGRVRDAHGGSPSLEGLPALDEGALNDLVATLGEGAVANMLPTFVANMVDYRDRLAAAINDADLIAAKRAAHAMKGLAAQFGAPQVSAIARSIEQDSATIADVSANLGKLVNAVAAAAQAIKARDNRTKAVVVRDG